MKTKWRGVVTENFSYKIVALFIALILWITILGRRDFLLTKNIEVEVIPGITQVITSQNVETVKVKVSGPRTALKRFMDSGFSQLISIDASRKGEGDVDLEIPLKQIDVPFGVKVLSVKPSFIRVHINHK